MVELSLTDIKAKWDSDGSIVTYTPNDVKGWLIYSIWDEENVVNTNNPFERIMIAIMNYTPEDYQEFGDMLNGDIYFYGVIDYEAITDTWREMQEYASDLAEYMYKTGKDNGLTIGHDKGYETGYDTGRDEGEEEGYSQGFAEGEREGYLTGKEEGYNKGLADGNATVDAELLAQRYQDGFAVGKEEGYKAGEAKGYSKGFLEGESSGMNSANAFTGMFVSLFQAPVTLFEGALNFDFLGINILAFVKTLLTLSVVGLIVFVVFKFMK
jgi:hypothetical protein